MLGANKIIYVSSALGKRIDGDTDDFRFPISIDTQSNEWEYDHATILQASIPRTWYVINTNNNKFTLTDDGGTRVITIPVGEYTITNLLITLDTLMSDGINNYTNTHSTLTGKVVLFYTNSINYTLLPVIQFPNLSLAGILGFNSTEVTLNAISATNANIASPNIANMMLTDSVYLRSDLISGYQGNQILTALPTGTTPYNSFITFIQSDPLTNAVKMTSTHSNIARFWITDSNGLPLDNNGIPMTFKLLLFKKDFVNEHIGQKLLTDRNVGKSF